MLTTFLPLVQSLDIAFGRMPLSHAKDESNASTLPDPELNPLLNPLLAAHMGRWAEVYFTTPPEKRGQAIAELLRELQSAPSQGETPFEDANQPLQEKSGPAIPADAVPVGAELLLTCPVCAHTNPIDQLFCGMCGAAMVAGLGKVRGPQAAEDSPTIARRSIEYESSVKADSLKHAMEPAAEAATASEPDAAPDGPQPYFPSIGAESEPAPNRYGPYLGTVLAILLVVVVYMAWRGIKAISGRPESAPAAISSPASPAQAAPADSVTPKAEPGNPHGQGDDSSASPQRGKKTAQPKPTRHQSADAEPASQLVTPAAGSSPLTPETSGGDDYANAQKYLNGAPGAARDSKEAALWLWKAVGKGNLAASLALSELYLRGDGVAKNCDQARLLLDAAARKGSRAAAERLKNLQAFGCE